MDRGSDDVIAGVPVAPFPGWLVCPHCRLLAPIEKSVFLIKPNQWKPELTRYIHQLCPKTEKPRAAIPARFIIACRNGHLDDFPWVYFVHDGPGDCRARLALEESGVGGTAADVHVQCKTCGARKNLAQAFGEAGEKRLPRCRGRHPHLHKFDAKCDQQMKAMLAGASNLWFPRKITVLTIPKATDDVGKYVEKYWAKLGQISDKQLLETFVGIPLVPERCSS